MAQQKEYMLSGLERELELYMGEEYETGIKTHTIKAVNTVNANVDVTFNIDESRKTGEIITSGHTYVDKKKIIHNVPEIKQEVERLKKRGNTTILAFAKERFEYNEETKTKSVAGTAGKNVDMKFEIDESKSILRASVWFVAKWVSNEYRLQAPVDQQIQDLKTFIDGLQLAEQELGDEYELHPDEESGFNYEKKEDLPVKEIDIGDLQEGDIIVSTTRYPLSKAIRLLSGSRVSHTALYIGNGEVVEALGDGVTRHSVEKATKDDKYAYVLRYPDLSLGAQGIIRGFAIKHANLKTPFDSWGMVLRAGLRIPGGGEKRFYCSELVLRSYEAAGIRLFETTQKRPGDIDELRGTKLDYVGHIKLTKKQLRKLDDSEFEMADEDNEWELEDVEEDDELSYEYEYEEDEEPDDEFEFGFENELNAVEDDGVTENFARRLYELSTRSYEGEYELDEELDRALDAVEDEFMVKRLHRKKKRGKRKGLFKKILGAGAKIVGKIANKTPIGSLIKAGTSLVRGNIKGALGNLAKAAVGTVLPPGVGTVATAAMDALGGGEEGGEAGEEGEVRRGSRRKRAIRRVARIARDTYREVADTLPEDFDHPLVANEVARKAVQKAMIKNGVRPPGKAEGIPRQKRVIKLRPGEKIVIIRS
ncbi:conserved hypothetical protein [Candidatus Brocadia pituitae]|nr:conserved hypothetical protein [Candidatus Brocadia pituitae]